MSVIILGIESSCDDTSAAVIKDGYLLSNVVSSQAVHEAYGGVVPELASRAHQQNIVPVVHEALKRAGVTKEELSAVAFTRGPGLMGSLLVGVSFAKGFARSLNIPLIDVNHLNGHVLAHFIKAEGEENRQPNFPFLCLLVSGGNSQIILVKAYNDMEILGQTIDDAAGEAIDKCSKVMGLGYPGGPIIDKLARQGNPKAFTFSRILRWQSMCTQEGGNNIHPLVFIIIQTAHDFQLQQFGLAIEPVTTLTLNRGNPHRAHLSQKTFRFGTHLYKVQLTGCFHCAGNSSPTLHNGHIAFTFQPPGELFGTLATKNKMGM